MNKTIPIVSGVLFTAVLIAVGIYVYKTHDAFNQLDPCGIDDGPFKAILADPIQLSDSAQSFILSDNGQLILDNRTNDQSPILTIMENGERKWTLDLNIANTRGYENYRFYRISQLRVKNDLTVIKLRFAGHWSYGIKTGTMEIARSDGGNYFCLSW